MKEKIVRLYEGTHLLFPCLGIDVRFFTGLRIRTGTLTARIPTVHYGRQDWV